jgi:hypothetical protein
MNARLSQVGIVAAAAGYLVVVAWAMGAIAYDMWGILIVIPPMTLLTVLGIRRLFSGDLQVLVVPMLVGFAAKLVGCGVRYWVAFDVYGGAADAAHYHDYARVAAGKVWSGDNNLGSVLLGAAGTRFVERFTGLMYTLFGSSKLAGFVLFGWLAFWGTALVVKGACIAVPGLAMRRYAWLCALAPSLVYWPSSIGKEAMMAAALGVATYGFARLLARQGFLAPVLYATFGLLVASQVRPHMAGVWLAGMFPALLVALGRSLRLDTRAPGRRGTELVSLLAVLAVAAVALVFVGQFALRFLKPGAEDAPVTEGITAILEETTRRSGTGGSNFAAPVISGPQDWPVAVLRTLTRPLPHEARGLFQLLSAAEIAALLALCSLSWRRILALLRAFLTIPFVAFAMTTLFVAGLAYASFANLGILTRQKSLVFPLLLLIPCLPYRRHPVETDLDPVEPQRELVCV